MSDSRRLTMQPSGGQPSKDNAKLKAIAGLIQGLTYSEMVKLSGMLKDRIDETGPNDFPSILIEIADELLK